MEIGSYLKIGTIIASYITNIPEFLTDNPTYRNIKIKEHKKKEEQKINEL